MTKDEALKLALEALEGVLDNSPKVLDASISGGLYEVVQCRDAITAIKEALAQPEHEPQRKPLTNEEIYKIYRDCGDLNVKINIARAIEAAHGIKEKNV